MDVFRDYAHRGQAFADAAVALRRPGDGAAGTAR
jgi:hypothetical protein